MEKSHDAHRPTEDVVPKLDSQQPNILGFRDTVIRDIKRFAPHIKKALDAYESAGDGHSVWGMLFYLQGSEVEMDSSGYVELGKQTLIRLEEDDMGADIADMHTRMRALGQTTRITDKAEYLMQGLLFNARGYGDGWAVAHMLHNMRAFPDLKEKPGVSGDDRRLMQDALQEARTERDAGFIGWMHLRMHGSGEQTEITTRDKAVFWREYKKTAKALDAGEPDGQTLNETVKKIVGLNYLYRKLIQQL